jgi:hypothetical protein
MSYIWTNHTPSPLTTNGTSMFLLVVFVNNTMRKDLKEACPTESHSVVITHLILKKSWKVEVNLYQISLSRRCFGHMFIVWAIQFLESSISRTSFMGIPNSRFFTDSPSLSSCNHEIVISGLSESATPNDGQSVISEWCLSVHFSINRSTSVSFSDETPDCCTPEN